MGISVIIPLYNKQDTIESTIQSVLSQTYSDFEIIVIDDGSKDMSRNVVESISDSRIRYVRQENKGSSATRNHGAQIARYEILAFLDADDLWDQKYLEELNKMVLEYPEASFFGIAYIQKFIKTNRDEYKQGALPRGWKGLIEDYSQFVSMRININASSYAIKKQKFIEIGGYNTEYKYGEDIYFCYCAMQKYKLAFYNEPLSYYINEQENQITTKYQDMKNDIVLHYFGEILRNGEHQYINEIRMIFDIRVYALSLANLIAGSKIDRYWVKQMSATELKKLKIGLFILSCLPASISRNLYLLSKKMIGNVLINKYV